MKDCDYRLELTRTAVRALEPGVPEKVAVAVTEFMTTTLLENPRRLGKPLLRPPYVGTWSARRGSYRVLYEIDDERCVVIVTAVEHRSDAYRSR